MFSYRHSYHAGNHADVLKHITQVTALRYLLSAKDTPLMLIDTHAGTGMYRLDGDEAGTSGEAAEGIAPLWEQHAAQPQKAPDALRHYLELIAQFNPSGKLRKYPGSPAIAAHLMRDQDLLRLFELHPVDGRLLGNNMQELIRDDQLQIVRNNGFTGLKTLLPPPSRRAMVLIDPSYELKTDYGQVVSTLQDALQRFATGCYMVWYPVIPRPESHGLPRRLKQLAQQAGKNWLHATLSIGRAEEGRDGLRASGMFVVNPPFVLKTELNAALPAVMKTLRRGTGAAWSVEGS